MASKIHSHIDKALIYYRETFCFEKSDESKQNQIDEIQFVLVTRLYSDITKISELNIKNSDLDFYIERNFLNIEKTATQIYQDNSHVLH